MTGLAGVRVWAVPTVGVSLTLVTETLREISEGFAGSVSEIIVKLTVAVPPFVQFVVQGFFGPLQEASTRAANKRVKERAFRRIIKHSTTEQFAFPSPIKKT